jgi:hypothetical protein
MTNTKQKILFLFLICFSIYCALTIGRGINQNVAKYYLKKNGYSNFRLGNSKDSNYIIMTNRVTSDKENAYNSENLVNCFDKFKGENVYKVTRNGLLLSVIRKIN